VPANKTSTTEDAAAKAQQKAEIEKQMKEDEVTRGSLSLLTMIASSKGPKREHLSTSGLATQKIRWSSSSNGRRGKSSC
jgi:hypothetical protein